LIHAEALNLKGNIKETLSNIASANDGVAISVIFIYGKKLLSHQNTLPEILKNTETVLLSHSIWNDKILVRMVAKDAYDLKSIQKNLISILADDNIPKVWNS
jgi:urease accessory protein UreH